MVYFEPVVSLILHTITCTMLCCGIIALAIVLGTSRPNKTKGTSYECGFKPFAFAYYPFDIQFYRVGILFLLFDVEILYFFPWVLNFYEITNSGHFIMLSFISLLVIGFLYEITSGALVWYPKRDLFI